MPSVITTEEDDHRETIKSYWCSFHLGNGVYLAISVRGEVTVRFDEKENVDLLDWFDDNGFVIDFSRTECSDGAVVGPFDERQSMQFEAYVCLQLRTKFLQ